MGEDRHCQPRIRSSVPASVAAVTMLQLIIRRAYEVRNMESGRILQSKLWPEVRSLLLLEDSMVLSSNMETLSLDRPTRFHVIVSYAVSQVVHADLRAYSAGLSCNWCDCSLLYTSRYQNYTRAKHSHKAPSLLILVILD